MMSRLPIDARAVALPLALLLLAATLLWVAIFAAIPEGPKTTRVELLQQVANYVAQFVLVTFIGGLVSFLLGQYTRRQERFRSALEEEQKTRRELLASLLGVRAKVEQARRSYRLVPRGEHLAGYRKAIEQILEGRLELSAVWHDVLTLQRLFGPDYLPIHEGLDGMKKYLDRLVDEFEAEEPKLSRDDGEAARDQIKGLPHFGSFVQGDGGCEYTKGYLEGHYRPAARMMRRHLLEPGVPAAMGEAGEERARPRPATL